MKVESDIRKEAGRKETLTHIEKLIRIAFFLLFQREIQLYTIYSILIP